MAQWLAFSPNDPMVSGSIHAGRGHRLNGNLSLIRDVRRSVQASAWDLGGGTGGVI